MIIKINKMGINGEGIGHIDRKPIFVEGALPEETVEIEITEDNLKYAKAKCINIIEPSKYRLTPPCNIQKTCGGCPLMIFDYSQQLVYKKKLIQEALEKYANMHPKVVENVRANPHPMHYRNALKLPVYYHAKEICCGLYQSDTNHVIKMETCLIHEEGLEAKRREILAVLNAHGIRDFNTSIKHGLRYIALRGFHGVFQCTLVTGNDILPIACLNALGQIEGLNSLFQNINDDPKNHEIFGKKMNHLYGAKTLEVKMDKMLLRLSPLAFFQLNFDQAQNLYRNINAVVKPCDLLVEAYCGVGGISLYLKDSAKKIIGIESIKDAVDNANSNARLNRANHLKFVCDDAAKYLPVIAKDQKIDTLVVDPPRSGLSGEMISGILKALPEQIIYVSCNPATMAKNLNDLKTTYKVERIIPYDLFSQTPHVECIVVLSHK